MIGDMLALLVSRRDFFLEHLLEHLGISFAAIAIAIVVGGIAGILISEHKKSAKWTLAFVNFVYTIPSISMLGFLIPLSGVGNVTAIIALTIYALLPMVRSTHTGLTNVNPAIIEAATGMGSTRAQTLFRIKLPLAMPVVMSGIRNMVTMTIALTGIASFIGAGGLGVAIYRGITTNNTSMTLAGSLLTALLALTCDLILGFAEQRMKMRTQIARHHNRIIGAIAFTLLTSLVVGIAIPKGITRSTIHIATKPMTEQYILGEMLDILIEHDTELNVELTQGVGGGTSNIEPALEKGDFDLYPEYTGTGWSRVLKHSDVYTEKRFPELQSNYQDKGLTWTGMYGFNNTFGLIVRKEIANKYGITTYSDLAKYASQLTFGAEYDFFERKDGYDALCHAYKMDFGKTLDLDIGLKYQALAEGKIDVMVIFTTDGQLSKTDAIILQDDRNFFPSYLCGTVVRNDTLRKHPELQNVFDKLTSQISDADMAQMNYQVDIEGQEPRDVAREFLASHSLLDMSASSTIINSTALSSAN